MTAGQETRVGAGDRVLALAGRAGFTAADALLIAATGAVAARARPAAGVRADDLLGRTVRTAAHPGTGLLLLAGAASADREGGARAPDQAPDPDQAPALDLDLMQSLARAVPDEDRSLVLSYVESLLAPYDPGLAWHLITSVLGAEGAVQHALGLDVAAHLDLVRASPWRPGVAMPAPLARQLAADRTARSAVAGELVGLDDPRLAGLGSDPDQIAMTPAQARVLAVAGAAADPGRVVDVGTHLLRRFPVHDLDASLRLMSRIAARAGFGHRVAAQARVEGFVTEQSAWVGAAAMAGALPVVAVVDLVRTLGPRIRDELDPGGELAAGLALIEALLYVGAVDEAMTWAVHWRLPVAVLVRRCLFAGLRSAAGRLATDPSLSRLTAAATDPDPDEIPRGLHGADAWWQPAGAEPAERLGALRDILAVVARTPWRVVPGSLADLLGVPADGDADGDADATQR